jgi:hypothetical protein
MPPAFPNRWSSSDRLGQDTPTASASRRPNSSNGKTKLVRVKELLSWFESQRRGVLVVREIRTALKKAKLVTVPDFEVAYIDQRIKLKALQATDKQPPVSKTIILDGHGTVTDSALMGSSCLVQTNE